MVNIKAVLTVGGSDPSGAAGIQADLNVFSSYRVHGMSVITALTSQNTCGVSGIMPVPAKTVEDQFRAVCEDLPVNALKIGMLASVENIDMMSRLLAERKTDNIVLDPVLISSSGARLIEEGGVEAIIKGLFPLVDLVTPNIDEAAALSGLEVDGPASMKKAARIIRDMGPAHVLVKGGHLDGRAIDILYDGTGFFTLDAPRIRVKDFRGTGCALSSAIAAGLARGMDMKTSAARAKDFVATSMKSGYEELGQGMGILNHHHPLL